MPTTETFTTPGTVHEFTVPNNVTEVTVQCWGAGGGDADSLADPGGYAEVVFGVSDGDILYIRVGGAGLGDGTGGYPDGGSGGAASIDADADTDEAATAQAGGGGGRSGVRYNSDIASAAKAIAGGGGGGADTDSASNEAVTTAGGAGGGTEGEDTNTASGTNGSAAGANGGTQSTAYDPAGHGAASEFDSDDDGTTEFSVAAAGGGGGGGLNTGEGGNADTYLGQDGYATGGAGGAGVVDGTETTLTQSGGNAGDGQVEITYIQLPTLDTLDATTLREITLNWTNNDTYDNINIYRATDSGSVLGDYTQIDQVPGSDTSYTDTGLLDGERYFYRIAPVVDSEVQDPTQELAATTILPAPTNLTHPSVGDTTADYSWTANANNGTIRVEYKDAAAGSWSTFATVSNTAEAETVTGLLMGNVYDSRVVAQTEHTESVDT